MDGPARCTCGYTGAARFPVPFGGAACPRCGRALASADSAVDTTHLVLATDPPDPARLPPWFDAPTINYATVRYAPPTGHPGAPTLPGYQILGELGRGGMGVVYKARQVKLNRVVALKMILAGGHAGPKDRERFRREAEAVAALQHPHIVQIFEIGEHNGQPYLALELVDGGTLADQLAGNPWPPRDAAALVERLARTVQYAHDQGIVHRDLKPGNILLQNADANRVDSTFRIPHSALVPKITDFGLAKRLDGPPGSAPGTGSGAVVGTPSYIAPEQAAGQGRTVGPPADIYSLGAILYELLTGRPPFHGDSPLETVLQVLKDDPVPPARMRPAVPKDLETICLTCLQKNVGRRYPSAAALADDLARFSDGRPVHARPVPAVVRAAKWVRRHPALAALGATTIAATAALIAVLVTAYAQVRAAVRDKEQEAAMAVFREQETERHRQVAEELWKRFAEVAQQRSTELEGVRDQQWVLSDENEKAQRSTYALQLSQVAALVERDPARAKALLENPELCPEKLRELTWHYLRRQCDRDELVYDRHANGSLAVAAAPDLPLVVTAPRRTIAGDLKVWDPRTGETWAVLTCPYDEGLKAAYGYGNHAVAFGPGGGLVAAACADGAVRVWRLPPSLAAYARQTAADVPPPPAPTPDPVRLAPAVTFVPHHLRARCLAFRPDGRALVTGGGDKAVRVWDVGDGPPAADPARGAPRMLAEMTDHAGPVTAVAYSPDGAAIAAGVEATPGVVLWAADGSSFQGLTPPPASVTAVAFSPDGRTLATAGSKDYTGVPGEGGEGPTIRLWDVKTRKPRVRLTGHTGWNYALAFSPDGQLLAGGGGRTVQLWAADTGQDRGVLTQDRGVVSGPAPNVTGVAFTADSRWVVSAADGAARVWRARAAGPDEGSAVEPRDAKPVTAATLSADGKLLVTGDAVGVTRVWRLDATPAGRAIPDGAPTFGQLSLARYCQPNTLVTGRVNAVAVSPDGRYVAAGGARGLAVIDLGAIDRTPRGGQIQALLARAFGARPREIWAVAFSPDGLWLATAEGSGVWLWDVRTGQSTTRAPLLSVRDYHRAGEAEFARAEVAVLPPPSIPGWTGGPLVAVASGSTVQLIDPFGRTVADAVIPRAAGGGVSVLAASPGGRWLAVGDWTGRVRVWEVVADVTVRLVPKADGHRHAGPVTALAFTRDGRTLVSGGRDRLVALWDPTTGQERATLTGHTDPLVGVGVLPADAGLVTVDREGAVKRWRADPKPADKGIPTLPATGPAGGMAGG